MDIRSNNKGWKVAPKIGNRYLALIFRLYIGGLFIYASIYKINYAGEFAETIASYQLVPFWAVNVLALVMPWTELFCGLLLVAGIRTRSVATMIAAMLGLFTLALAINLLRGAPIVCGCFRATDDPIGWTTLVRDLAWLAMTVYVYFFDSAWQLEKLFLIPLEEV
ncbi:MAG: DoxX family membrane protein [Deltaproteobacteria bacterium]|nr:MAG: DoxX family membrane protein [Deltaproteobacteria bacterium]